MRNNNIILKVIKVENATKVFEWVIAFADIKYIYQHFLIFTINYLNFIAAL